MSEKELLPMAKAGSKLPSGHFSGSLIADELFKIGYSLGKDEIMLEIIKKVVKNMPCSLEDAMRILEIPANKQAEYAAML